MSLIKMSASEYHARPELGSTSLKRALITPAHYWGYAPENPDHEKMEETEPLIFGRVAHCVVLETPEIFHQEFAVYPEDIDRRTNIGKERYQMFLAQSGNKMVIKQNMVDTTVAMRKVLEQHFVWKYLQSGVSEGCHFWSEDGLDYKVRLDWVKEVEGPMSGKRIIVDYKTAADASPDGFSRQMNKLNYHVQAAHYLEGDKSAYGDEAAAFLFIAQEKKFPYAVGAYMVDPQAIQNGFIKRKKAIDIIKKGRETGFWPGYTEKIEIIDIPTYAQYQAAEDLAAYNAENDDQETGE